MSFGGAFGLLGQQEGNEFKELVPNKSSDPGARQDKEKSTRIKLMRWEKEMNNIKIQTKAAGNFENEAITTKYVVKGKRGF